MPFSSQAQWRQCFAANKPGWDCRKWAHATPGGKLARFRRLPRKKKAYTVADLEQAVLKDYAPAVVAAIAAAVPELPRLKGEQLAPGVTRIHGNLCNVHGRYGRCPGAQAKPVKPPKPARPRRGAKPKKGGAGKKPVDPAKAREHAEDRAHTLQRRQEVEADRQARLAREQQRDAEHAADRQRRDQERAQREADKLRKQQEAAAKPKKGGGGGGKKKPEKDTSAQDAARRSRERAQLLRDQERRARQSHQDARQERLDRERAQRQARQDAAPVHREPATPQVTTPELADAARSLQAGDTLSQADATNLVRNGLARRDRRSGELILTVQGQRATRQKAASFTVFKDATGRYRWVAISSTAYQDRDGEIVSTKALADDVARADADGTYGVLDWWHMPSIVLGDCDFNAMSGRVLIESGTFCSPAIAEKVARAAPELELSIAFFHPPSEPDAHGVFHTIRRFARGLTPRGKASNLFTSFHVKESPMDETKKAALKALGFSDTDIADLETRAAQTQKAADAAGVKYKAEEPQPPEEVTIGGVVYTLKAAPVAEKAPMPMDAEDLADGGVDEAAEGEPPLDDTTEGGLTLSPEDLAAIGQMIGEQLQGALAQIMGGLDLEKKVASHVQGLMQPYQAQKDSEAAEAKQRTDQLDTRLKTVEAQQADLLGLQPAVNPFRPSADPATTLKEGDPLLETIREQIPQGGQFDDLYKNLFGGAVPALPPVPGS